MHIFDYGFLDDGLLPDVSPTTVEAVLGKMVKDGSVKKIGSARATKYENAKHIRWILLFTEPNVETVVLLGKRTDDPKDYVKIGLNVEDYYKIKDIQNKQWVE